MARGWRKVVDREKVERVRVGGNERGWATRWRIHFSLLVKWVHCLRDDTGGSGERSSGVATKQYVL